MNIIGITGQEGVGKTTLAKEFEKENAIIMDVDKISRDFYQNNDIIEKTIIYLEEKYDIYITELPTFFDALTTARKEIKQLDDPIYKAIEAKIDEMIDSNKKKNTTIVLDWELLPKTKYFKLSDYNVLLLPDNDVARKESKKRKDIFEEEAQKSNQKNKYNIDYQTYKYDRIAIDLHDNAQISLLKDFIVKELDNAKK